MNTRPTSLLFVVNPISGDIDKGGTPTALQTFCEQHGIRCLIYETCGDDDRQQVQAMIEQEQPDAVVAVGGDGTVHLVGTLLIGKSLPMGIIPQGSGNGLSKDLDIPQDFDQALAVIEKFQVNAIDTLRVNGTPSLHLADLGFNALIVKRFSEGEKRGPAAYAWHVMREYLNYQPKEYHIVTDKEEYRGKAFMVAIANANMFGSNAVINPEGVVDDGVFEVAILEEFPKLEGIGILYQLFTAKIHNSLRSRILQCRRATIHNLENELLQADGEVLAPTQTVEVEMLPKSLRVIVPAVH